MAWQGGESKDGSDSLAIEVEPKSHWEDLQALICVVSDAKKGTPSTAGMQKTVQTSPFLQKRIQDVVPKRMKDIIQSIKSKDFDTFARITMDDSNNFHSTCLDTSPPIFYLNDTSRNIIQLVEEVNRASKEDGGENLLAYTFDAGPNAVIYAVKENMPWILQLIRHYFPNTEFDDTVSSEWKVLDLDFRLVPNSAIFFVQIINLTIPSNSLFFYIALSSVQSSGSRSQRISPRSSISSGSTNFFSSKKLQLGNHSNQRTRCCQKVDSYSSRRWTKSD